ncbi:MAG: hypothetical protein ABI042_19535 [Verrucomicrobiota bacterium]
MSDLPQPPLQETKRAASRNKVFIGVAVFIGIILVFAVLPYKLIATPNSKIRVIDDDKQPLTGLRVVRSWKTSEDQNGEEEAVTDSSGEVRFKQVGFSMSLLKRLTKPLLIFVPASCGLSWEIYGHSEFRIYWPNGYKLRFDDGTWKKVYSVYQNNDGVYMRDPERPITHFRLKTSPKEERFVNFYFLNKREDFDYTLTVYKKDKL